MKPVYKRTLWVLCGVYVIAMLSLTPMFVQLHRETKEALQDVSDYSNRIVTREYDRAYEYSSSAFRTALPHDRFVSLYEGLENQYGPLKSVKRQYYEVHGHGTPMMWRAEVDEDFLYEKQTLRFEFVLHKENGHWAIFSAEQL